MRQQGRNYRAYDANTGRWKMVRHRSQTPYSRVTLIPPREPYVPSLIDLSVDGVARNAWNTLNRISLNFDVIDNEVYEIGRRFRWFLGLFIDELKTYFLIS